MLQVLQIVYHTHQRSARRVKGGTRERAEEEIGVKGQRRRRGQCLTRETIHGLEGLAAIDKRKKHTIDVIVDKLINKDGV
jgi:hypothetical protein